MGRLAIMSYYADEDLDVKIESKFDDIHWLTLIGQKGQLTVTLSREQALAVRAAINRSLAKEKKDAHA
jgi:hypothetical protein